MTRETISVNGVEKPLSADTVAELLRAERIDPAARFLAIAVNGTVVPRSEWERANLTPGDRVEIVRPAPGG